MQLEGVGAESWKVIPSLSVAITLHKRVLEGNKLFHF